MRFLTQAHSTSLIHVVRYSKFGQDIHDYVDYSSRIQSTHNIKGIFNFQFSHLQFIDNQQKIVNFASSKILLAILSIAFDWNTQSINNQKSESQANHFIWKNVLTH